MTKTFTVFGYGRVKNAIRKIYDENFDDECCLRNALDSRFAQALQTGIYLYVDVIEHFHPYRKRRIYGPRKGKK